MTVTWDGKKRLATVTLDAPVVYRLTPGAMSYATQIGMQRSEDTRRKGGVHNFQPPAHWGPHDGHIMAAKSELVVAADLDLFWCPDVGNLDEVDVGDMVEVRAINSDGFCLRIRRKDADPKNQQGRQHPYVLTHVDHDPAADTVTILGWAFPGEAVHLAFWAERRKGRAGKEVMGEDGLTQSYWNLPQVQLHPISWLRAIRETWIDIPRCDFRQELMEYNDA